MPTIEQMELQTGQRYEVLSGRSYVTQVPVTHVLMEHHSGIKRFAYINTRFHVVGWCIYDEHVIILAQGTELNFEHTAQGYAMAIKRALVQLYCRGRVQRVFPRNPAHRRLARCL